MNVVSSVHCRDVIDVGSILLMARAFGFALD